MRFLSVILTIMLLVSLCGCTSTQKGALVGGTVGCAAGAGIGYFAQDEKAEDALMGAVVGAATGALAGAIIGYYSGE